MVLWWAGEWWRCVLCAWMIFHCVHSDNYCGLSVCFDVEFCLSFTMNLYLVDDCCLHSSELRWHACFVPLFVVGCVWHCSAPDLPAYCIKHLMRSTMCVYCGCRVYSICGRLQAIPDMQGKGSFMNSPSVVILKWPQKKFRELFKPAGSVCELLCEQVMSKTTQLWACTKCVWQVFTAVQFLRIWWNYRQFSNIEAKIGVLNTTSFWIS